MIISGIFSLVIGSLYVSKTFFTLSASYPNQRMDFTISLNNFWSISSEDNSFALSESLSSSKIFFAHFGHIHGMDWKNFTSIFLTAFDSSSDGVWASWNAVLLQIQFTFKNCSKICFCSNVSNAKYCTVLLFSS